MVCAWTGAKLLQAERATSTITRVRSLELGQDGDLVFLDNPRYLRDLPKTRATACLLEAHHAAALPAQTAALVTPDPYRALAIVLGHIYPNALSPQSVFAASGISPGALLHPECRLEDDVVVDPGAVIGPDVEIGAHSVVGANAVIAAGVRVGRHCSVGAGASVSHALIGDHVIIHPGVRIGQDGFGFAMGAKGHRKVPQLGRVIIQDHVEIGANTTIDRGSSRDTVIGEGTKIDNLVQIAHNVVIGRHCVIVAQVGISGSCTLGDFVVIGGQAGLAGHLTIGSGAQIAASSGLMHSIPAGEKWGGTPAQPLKNWLRETALLRKLNRKNPHTS